MDEMELKSIWDAYDKKLEKSLSLNLRILEGIQKDKAKSNLNALLGIKVIGVVTGILWILFLGVLVYGNHFKNTYFSASVLAILLFSVAAVAIYSRHIIFINKIDYTNSITDAQSRLSELQVSTINSTRFIWLQLPFYTTFFWNQEWMTKDSGFWLIAFPITLIFTVLAIWLYKNLTPANIHKAWVKRFMMIGMEYKYALSASEMLQEIEEFKKG
jgi:hypothetical protein